MHSLVIIGGGGAGLTAALTAKRFNWDINVTLISNSNKSYSPCSLPFVISKEIPSFGDITHDLKEICEESHIECVLDEAVEIDCKNQVVKTKENGEYEYKSLVLATGGSPIRPGIEGIELDNIFNLHRIHQAEKIKEKAEESESAVVVGGGAVGVESAAALRKLGLDVTLVELCPQLFSHCFDKDFSKIIQQTLEEEEINVICEASADKFIGDRKLEAVKVGEEEIPADLSVLGVGVQPNVKLAKEAGIKTVDGAIEIDGWMRTNYKNVYAAGDCVLTYSMVTGRQTMSQLGTTAMRQGKIAGTNAVGGFEATEGVLNSMVLKLFDLELGRTGLTKDSACECEMDTVVGRIKTKTKPPYFPGAEPLHVKLIFNKLNRQLVGAQIVGKGEGVADKIDLCAYAIQRHSTMERLMQLRYCYTPPLTPVTNAIVDAAENAYKKLARLKEAKKHRF